MGPFWRKGPSPSQTLLLSPKTFDLIESLFSGSSENEGRGTESSLSFLFGEDEGRGTESNLQFWGDKSRGAASNPSLQF